MTMKTMKPNKKLCKDKIKREQSMCLMMMTKMEQIMVQMIMIITVSKHNNNNKTTYLLRRVIKELSKMTVIMKKRNSFNNLKVFIFVLTKSKQYIDEDIIEICHK